ncbi:hypothetical protein ACFL6P_10375 [Candidatus Latescibacterota bacterium]
MTKRFSVLFSSALLTFVTMLPVDGIAENNSDSILFNYTGARHQRTFPDMADDSSDELTFDSIVTDGTSPGLVTVDYAASRAEFQADQAIWPFGSKEKSTEKVRPKSSRKAFFLSLLLPGLGETYVGSKRGLLFMGAEVFAWYMYLTNTGEGNDLEAEYQEFAETHWNYTDKVHSDGSDIYYNYWDWLVNVYDINEDEVQPEDYLEIKEIVEDAGASHSLPTTKTQQYYEMIGKYDHFVYGWEDITDLNPSLLTDGEPNGTYVAAVDTGKIKSDLRLEYMSVRGKSNDKLKAGQMGINVMILNRICSAISAGRLAYHHNKQFETDLSKVRIHFVEKYIIDNKVPMVMLTKKF